MMMTNYYIYVQVLIVAPKQKQKNNGNARDIVFKLKRTKIQCTLCPVFFTGIFARFFLIFNEECGIHSLFNEIFR